MPVTLLKEAFDGWHYTASVLKLLSCGGCPVYFPFALGP
jgi:hypothetical protein